MSKRQRRWRNYFLQPLLQVKLGLYSIILSLLFTIVFTTVLILSFKRLFDLILELTDLREEVIEIINGHLMDIGGWLILILFMYLAASVVLSVLFTHRLIGPTIAFRRHVRALAEGAYNSRVTLRKSDAFAEVAEELNNLAEVLENKGP